MQHTAHLSLVPPLVQPEVATPCTVSPRACPFGGACHTCPARVQAKLAVSRPGDKYEQEADRVADLVMRMPEPCPTCGPRDKEEEKLQAKPLGESITPMVQRQAEPEEVEKEEEPIQAKPLAESIPLDDTGSTATLTAVGHILHLPGQPLDPATCAFFEPRFGHDFSHVRVHTDSQAAESARAVNALAYTAGHNIVFGLGQYAPGAEGGRQLLAHELTHVVQQGTAPHFAIQRLSYRGCGPEPLGFPHGIIRALRIAWNLSFPRLRIAKGGIDRVRTSPSFPQSITNLLTRDFMTTPTQMNRLNTISANYGRILNEFPDDTYSCVTDPVRCPGPPVGGIANLGSHEPGICANNFMVASLPERVRIVIHETAHAMAPSLGNDFYQADGYSGMTAAQALNNADSYAAFARDCPQL